MKNTRIYSAKSAFDQPTTENSRSITAQLRNSEYHSKNQCPEPNANGLIDFIYGNPSEINNLLIEFKHVHCTESGKSSSEERKFLRISASNNRKIISFFDLDERKYTAETLQKMAIDLSTAIIRRVLKDFEWVEEYEIDISKFNFIGLFTFLELKPRDKTYEEFVKTEAVLPIQPCIPQKYLQGNHIAIIRCGNRILQISSFAGSMKLKFENF